MGNDFIVNLYEWDNDILTKKDKILCQILYFPLEQRVSAKDFFFGWPENFVPFERTRDCNKQRELDR